MHSVFRLGIEQPQPLSRLLCAVTLSREVSAATLLRCLQLPSATSLLGLVCAFAQNLPFRHILGGAQPLSAATVCHRCHANGELFAVAERRRQGVATIIIRGQSGEEIGLIGFV